MSSTDQTQSVIHPDPAVSGPGVVSGQGLTLRVAPENEPDSITIIEAYTRTAQCAIDAYSRLVTDSRELGGPHETTRCSVSRAEAFATNVLVDSEAAILGFVKAEAKRLKETF